MSAPFLSIVVPMREGFSTQWLQALLKIRGDVEFILVHPPSVQPEPVADNRLLQLVSPFRGEIIQRLNGLLNASGQYVLTFNCDEFIHPEVPALAQRYFEQFPESWLMRLSKTEFPYGDTAALSADWEALPEDLTALPICRQADGNLHLYEAGHLLEIPIAPLHNRFDWKCLWRGRQDQQGPHTENFDKKVWVNEKVQAALQEILPGFALAGPVKYLPFWCLDRLLGLGVQATFYDTAQPHQVIGYKLPHPALLRVEDNPPEFKRKGRFYLFAEIILLRRFGQYGYVQNLIVHQIREFPVRALASIKRKLTIKQSNEAAQAKQVNV